MFHVGDDSIENAKYLAKNAEAVGVDYILIVSPCIFKPASSLELLEILDEVAAAAPNTPSFYYHYPGVYGVDFKMQEYLQLAVDKNLVPTLVGVKFIAYDMADFAIASTITKKDGSTFGLYCRTDYIVATMPFQAAGSPMLTFQTALLVQIREAYVAGD